MEDVRTVFVDENTVFIVMIVRVAADMIAAVANENALIELAGQPLRDDTPGVARANDEIIEHYDCNPFLINRRERPPKYGGGTGRRPGLLASSRFEFFD